MTGEPVDPSAARAGADTRAIRSPMPTGVKIRKRGMKFSLKDLSTHLIVLRFRDNSIANWLIAPWERGQVYNAGQLCTIHPDARCWG